MFEARASSEYVSARVAARVTTVTTVSTGLATVTASPVGHGTGSGGSGGRGGRSSGGSRNGSTIDSAPDSGSTYSTFTPNDVATRPASCRPRRDTTAWLAPGPGSARPTAAATFAHSWSASVRSAPSGSRAGSVTAEPSPSTSTARSPFAP